MNISSFVCDCIKTSSNHEIAFLVSMSGLKILLMNAEKAAGPMDIPWNNLLNSYCSFPITSCVNRRDFSSSG